MANTEQSVATIEQVWSEAVGEYSHTVDGVVRVGESHARIEEKVHRPAGLLIHLAFTVFGMANRPIQAIALFHHADEAMTPVPGPDPRFQTDAGQLCVALNFTTPAQSAPVSDFPLLLPWTAFGSGYHGQQSFLFYVILRESGGAWTELVRSDTFPLTLAWP